MPRLRKCVGGALLIALLAWASNAIGFSPLRIVQGVPHAIDFIRRSIPPDASVLTKVISSLIETLQVSVLSTAFGAAFGFGLGFLAARNVSPPWIRNPTRLLLSGLRAIPALLYALVFVAMVGLGPFPGVLALTVGTASLLGKLFSEVIEGIDPGPVEAVTAAGAGRMQTLLYAVLPQVSHLFLGLTLYCWEINIRSATVLGLVGAGGIGYRILMYMKVFNYRAAAMAILSVLVTVVLLDYASSYARRRLI